MGSIQTPQRQREVSQVYLSSPSLAYPVPSPVTMHHPLVVTILLDVSLETQVEVYIHHQMIPVAM